MVVFLQGCMMRCKYCHNPDTWSFNDGKEMDGEGLIARYRRNQAYYQHGGITLSGGEPLAQSEFVLDFAKQCKHEGIHLAIDTSGAPYRGDTRKVIDSIIDFTDLFLLDIKYPFEEGYTSLTGQLLQPTLDLANAIDKKGKDMWIRYVVVPSLTDDKDAIEQLAYYISQWKSVKRIEFLPYHTMALPKYKRLGIDYPLQGIPKANEADIQRVRQWFNHAYALDR